MDIAALSMQMSMTQTHMNAGFSLAKKVMDISEVQADGLMDMVDQAVPSFGHQMDIRV